MLSSKRIGIFAGTFDPVHNGHVAFALAAIKACRLDEVIFLPEPKPRGKQQVTGMNHRLAMIRVAIAGEPRLRVVELTDDQFTVAKTLPELERRLPGAHLALLLGTDVARGLRQWPGADGLLAKVELIIALRQGDEPPHGVKAAIIPTSHGHVAASHVRGGQSNDIAPAVRDYIHHHGLYRV
jgi:nicotinate (nicotinamide) nucleotide adenylyltransferase